MMLWCGMSFFVSIDKLPVCKKLIFVSCSRPADTDTLVFRTQQILMLCDCSLGLLPYQELEKQVSLFD